MHLSGQTVKKMQSLVNCKMTLENESFLDQLPSLYYNLHPMKHPSQVFSHWCNDILQPTTKK